ncbi:MAG: hypothetical protein R3F59_37595 [Myxococcota bacterium]
MLIALFGGASLAMTSYTKGSQAMLVRVEVIDLLPDVGLARGATWLGVFSTRKTTLSLQSGEPDAVLAPLVEPGFQSDPAVVAGAGPGLLSYGAETWTLAYARSDWTAPSRTLELRPTADGWALTNRLGYPLDEVVVQVPDAAGVVRLGALPDAATVAVPVLDPSAATQSASAALQPVLDAFTGAAEPESRALLPQREAVIVARADDRAVEPVVLSGLSPVAEPTTIVRMPAPLEPSSARFDDAPTAATLACDGEPVDAVAVRGSEVTWRGAVGTAACTVHVEGVGFSVDLPAAAGLHLGCGDDDEGGVICEPEGR